LPNLRGLFIQQNQLIGTIPDFNALPNLQDLYLQDNQLTGTIPDFGALPNLQALVLELNKLTGTIPDFSALFNLRNLILSDNQLIGTIPVSSSTLINLEYLDLRNNLLCKKTDFNYSVWPIRQSRWYDYTTWQEQLETFPVCTSSNQPPIAAFKVSPQQGQPPLTVTLDAGDSSDPDGTIVTYDWSVNGQPTSPDSGVTNSNIREMTFNTAGTYTIELTVTDNDGLTDEAQKTVKVDETRTPDIRIEPTTLKFSQ